MRIFLFILILFVFIVSPKVHAQETENLNSTESLPIPTISITPTVAPSIISYELPYPGILPGNPLYSLKVIRDRVVEALISDSLKKSEFFLLQADKRLAAGLTLHANGKTEAAETTISKSQNYLEKSFGKLVEAKNSQKNVSDLYAKIKSSSSKQRQEIENLSKTTKGEEGKKLVEDFKRAQQLEKRVDEFKP